MNINFIIAKLSNNSIILLEEELRAVIYFQPVLGLPDTLKAKILIPFRENLIASLVSQFNKKIEIFELDFNKLLKLSDSTQSKNWKPLREGVSDSSTTYPMADSEIVAECRALIRKETVPMIRKTFPSLADIDIVDPSDDWIPES